MALGLLAGIGLAAPAIQRGIDDQKARERADEEQAYLREQRENARADRSFGLGQRQRLLTEQGRQDQLLSDLNNVPQSRQVDVRNLDQRQITVDEEGNQLPPATKAMPMPEHGKLKYQADAYRKAGQMDKALAFDEAANKALFADSARKFQTLVEGSKSMSLSQLARAAADIYNQDPLPAQVQDIQPTAAGGVKVFFRNENGVETVGEFKDKRQLLSQLETYYSPVTYAAVRQKQQDLRDKAIEKASEPVKTAPGERVSRVNPDTGQVEELFVNTTPTAAQLRATGQGAGGGKPVDQNKQLMDMYELAVTKGEVKLTPSQISQGQRIALDLARRNIDPALAIEVAVEVAQDPSKARLEVNKYTGEIDQIYQNPRVNRGNPIAISQGAGSFADLEKLAKETKNPKLLAKVAEDVLGAMVEKLPEDQRQTYRDQLLKIAADPALRKAYLQQAQAMGKDVEILERQLGIVGKFMPPAPPAPAPSAPRVGGLFPQAPAMQLPADSPSAKFQARQAALREQQNAADARKAERVAALGAEFRADMASMDPIALAQKYDRLRADLPPQDAAALQQLERQIRWK